MMIDLDKTSLTMIPHHHTLVGQSVELAKVSNENKALKQSLFIGLTILTITIIYLNNRYERREEKN
jgi:hypothetical protein